MSSDTVDLRHLPKDRHLAELTGRFQALPIHGALIVAGGCRELDDLHTAFERDWSGTYEWQRLSHEPPLSRDRVLKMASARLPRVLTDTTTLPATGAGGAIWTLQPGDRQLDANIIHLPPGDRIDAPTGSDLDVLLIILDGDGDLHTETGTVPLEPGQLAWLPRRSRRSIVAGSHGLNYLTVHTRRVPMTIGRREDHAASATDRPA